MPHPRTNIARTPVEAPLTSMARILALAVATGGLVAGCGGSGHGSTTSGTAAQQTASTPAITSAGTAGAAAPKHHGSAGGAHGGSGSAQSSAQAAGHASGASSQAAKPVAPVIPAGPVIHSYSGVGDATIGSVSERSTIVLEWSTPKPPIQLFTSHGFMLIDSHASSGRVKLGRGTYSGLRVAAKGSWTIRLRATA